jgi:hypothetical protein
MRATENLAMSSTVVIKSPQYSSGAFGSVLENYVASGTTLCDIWPIPRFDREKSSGNQDLSKGEFYVSVPYNTTVSVTDQLVIDDITYQVTFVPKAQSWLTNLRLEVRNYNGA